MNKNPIKTTTKSIYDKYGVANAVTLAAKKEETWERSVELERIGGNLISLPIEEFKSLDG